MKNNGNLDFPAKLLHSVNEHTGGGFIMFYIDKNGEPQGVQLVDNKTLFKGLISYIEDTVESVREIDKITRVTEIHGDDPTEEL